MLDCPLKKKKKKRNVNEMSILLKGNTSSVSLEGYKCVEIFVAAKGKL